MADEMGYDDHSALEALPNSSPAAVPLDVEEAALFLRALSNENRLALLTLLQTGEQTVTSLADTLNMRQPAVSQQLGRLREARLVDFRREGKTVYYRLASDRIRDFLPVIQQHFTL
jgi:DNA-binding transcriptional ArsR family regulator